MRKNCHHVVDVGREREVGWYRRRRKERCSFCVSLPPPSPQSILPNSTEYKKGREWYSKEMAGENQVSESVCLARYTVHCTTSARKEGGG